MTLYKDNLVFLNKHYPDLVRQLDHIELGEEYVITENANKEMNLYFKREDRQYTLHSKYNAADEAVRWCASLQEKTKDIKYVLLSGIGLGYFLEAFLEHTDVPYVFIYEPSLEIFNCLLHARDIRGMLSDPRIRTLAIGDNEFLQHQIAADVSKYVTDSFSFVSPPIYQRIFGELFNQLHQQIKGYSLNQLTDFHTYMKHQKQWIFNIMSNFPYTVLHPSVHELKDRWKGVKVIIVGSGPSLNEDIHYLKQLRGKCFVIAAGSSIQALEKSEVYPDLIVSFDSGLPNYRIFQKIDVTRIPLLFSSQIYYKIVEEYKAELLHVQLENDSITPFFYDNHKYTETFYSTTSVTGLAIQIGAYLGASEIILMGQDLSYPNSQFYAAGVGHINEKTLNTITNNANALVENVDGGSNPTTTKMLSTLHDIEITVTAESMKGVKVINSSKHGALIKGTEWKSMDDMVPELQKLSNTDFNISEQLNQSSEEERVLRFNNAEKKLLMILKQTTVVEKKLNLLQQLMQNLGEAVAVRNINKASKGLNEVNKQWQSITRQDVFDVFYSFSLKQQMNMYMRYVPEIVETTQPLKKAELIVRHLGSLVEAMRQYTPELLNVLNHSQESWNSHLTGVEQ